MGELSNVYDYIADPLLLIRDNVKVIEIHGDWHEGIFNSLLKHLGDATDEAEQWKTRALATEDELEGAKLTAANLVEQNEQLKCVRDDQSRIITKLREELQDQQDQTETLQLAIRAIVNAQRGNADY